MDNSALRQSLQQVLVYKEIIAYFFSSQDSASHNEVSPIEPSKESDSKAISLSDFELIRVIGRGSYAKVLMVELKKTKRIYAMKVIKKELVTDDEVRTLLASKISWMAT